MNIDKVRDDITKLVEDILDKKAIAGLQADVDEALSEAKKSVLDMTEKVAEMETREASDAAVLEALEASKGELETELAAKNGEVDSLTVEKEVLLKRVESAESTLETMEKDKLTDNRMTELEGLKITRAGEAREKQALFVRDMSDEDFAAYRDDMVALREEIAASLRPKAEENTDEDPSGETAGAEGEEGDNVLTPPADIQSALETATVTLPNAETAGTENKWDRFGPNLAEYMRSNRGEASKDNK
ncbi:MAG: hypothetical protein KAS32_01395 [Candidatus Peribacteraceae bacterium]|nr:hypothetical protein [Candidatus Peribacteraceae bacterium]